MPFYRKNYWGYLYLLVIVGAILSLFVTDFSDKIKGDLSDLLPNYEMSEVEKKASHLITASLNNEILVLVGGEEATSPSESKKAFLEAKRIQANWQVSGVFDQVLGEQTPDIEALQKVLFRQQLALISEERWQAYQEQKQQHIQAQVKSLFNPFSDRGLLAIEQDWLGLGKFIQEGLRQQSAIQWDMDTHYLYLQKDGKIWFVIRATLAQGQELGNIPAELLSLIQKTYEQAQQEGVELLMAGGAIFAAQNKGQGESESRWMSVLGISFILLFLGGLFKSVRVLSLLLTLGVGLLMGTVVTIFLCGSLHLFTFLIGTSLIGVLLDFPLHYLAPSLVQKSWHINTSLCFSLKAFWVSLVITVLGYISLSFTALPILQQTAVFSIAALLGAFLTSLWIIPLFFQTWRANYSPLFVVVCQYVLDKTVILRRLCLSRLGMLLMMGLTLWGLSQLNSKDDMREWAFLSPETVQQASKIAQLTGIHPSGQYLLVLAEDEESLFLTLQQVSQKLRSLQEKGDLGGWLSLEQNWVSQAIQEQRKVLLKTWQTQENLWEPLYHIGVSKEDVEMYHREIQALPGLNLNEVLSSPFTQAYKHLYLGQFIQDGRPYEAALIQLFNVKNTEALAMLERSFEELFFMNQRAKLNALFLETRDMAVWLKLVSYVFAFILLLYFFKLKQAIQVLAVPLLASTVTLAVFAYLGWNLSLFAIFGLLLVTALGTDYALFMQSQELSLLDKISGILLAVITTIVSFGILGFSQIPAIAMFGRSVAIGTFFSLIFILLIVLPRGKDDARV